MTDPIDQLQGRSLPSRRTILRGVAGGKTRGELEPAILEALQEAAGVAS